MRPWAEQLIQEIGTNELLRYERQAREAADKAATLLRGEFINALTESVETLIDIGGARSKDSAAALTIRRC